MDHDLALSYDLVRRTRAGVLDWFATAPPEVFARTHDDVAHGSPSGIYAHVDEALSVFDDLDAPLDWTSSSGKAITPFRRWLLLHPITHEFHHKGQALSVARALGHPHPGRPDTVLADP